MNWFTDEEYQKLLANGANRDKDHPPVVMLGLPFTNCIWLISEVDPVEPRLAFGLCDLGMGFPELGYVDLEELRDLTLSTGLAVEKVQFFVSKHPMSVYANAAREISRITTNDALLSKHSIKPKL
jgi:hypothetical protein